MLLHDDAHEALTGELDAIHRSLRGLRLLSLDEDDVREALGDAIRILGHLDRRDLAKRREDFGHVGLGEIGVQLAHDQLRRLGLRRAAAHHGRGGRHILGLLRVAVLLSHGGLHEERLALKDDAVERERIHHALRVVELDVPDALRLVGALVADKPDVSHLATLREEFKDLEVVSLRVNALHQHGQVVAHRLLDLLHPRVGRGRTLTPPRRRFAPTVVGVLPVAPVAIVLTLAPVTVAIVVAAIAAIAAAIAPVAIAIVIASVTSVALAALATIAALATLASFAAIAVLAIVTLDIGVGGCIGRSGVSRRSGRRCRGGGRLQESLWVDVGHAELTEDPGRWALRTATMRSTDTSTRPLQREREATSGMFQFPAHGDA